MDSLGFTLNKLKQVGFGWIFELANHQSGQKRNDAVKGLDCKRLRDELQSGQKRYDAVMVLRGRELRERLNAELGVRSAPTRGCRGKPECGERASAQRSDGNNRSNGSDGYGQDMVSPIPRLPDRRTTEAGVTRRDGE